MRVRTDRLSPARRALVRWRSRWRVSSCNNPARFVGRSGQTERRSIELNCRPYMTKAGSPVSDEAKEPGLLVRAASQPTSRCNRAQQSPADPEPPPRNTMLSEHRDLGAAEPATRWNGPRSQTKSRQITRDNVPSSVLFLSERVARVGGASPSTGHAGHHGPLGAVAGCAIEHHEANVQNQKPQAAQANTPNGSPVQ